MIKDTATTSRNIEKAYNDKKYIVAYKTVYQPFYSVNAGFYAMPVYQSTEQMGLTLRGRFFHQTGDQVNSLIGFDHFNNL